MVKGLTDHLTSRTEKAIIKLANATLKKYLFGDKTKEIPANRPVSYSLPHWGAWRKAHQSEVNARLMRVWRSTLYYNSPEKIIVKCAKLCTEKEKGKVLDYINKKRRKSI